MTEFHAQLTERAHEAAQLLTAARESGDDYSVDVHTADLDNIVRIARDHGVELPALPLPAPSTADGAAGPADADDASAA